MVWMEGRGGGERRWRGKDRWRGKGEKERTERWAEGVDSWENGRKRRGGERGERIGEMVWRSGEERE